MNLTNLILELLNTYGVVLILSVLAMYLGYRLYNKLLKNKSLKFIDNEEESVSYACKIQKMLNNSPYTVIIRNKECIKYTKWNCHIAHETNSNEKILVIDIDE